MLSLRSALKNWRLPARACRCWSCDVCLIKIGYSEHVWFGNGKDPNDSSPGLAESVGYIRGLLKGLSVV